MTVVELARYTVDPRNEEVFLQHHRDAVEAMRRRYPTLLEANLARLDPETWIDIWMWESSEAAKQAAAEASEVPEAAALFSLIDSVVSMEHSELVSGVGSRGRL